MKNSYKNVQLLLLSMVLLSLTGCLKNYEDMNRNPNQVTDAQMGNYKVGAQIRMLEGFVVPTQEHLYQFTESLVGGPLGGYIGATVDTWQTKFETFNPSADWRKWPFANVITETYAPYRGVVNGTTDEVPIALANLFRVAIMSRVTDTYGPIPYTKIIDNPKESIYVEYDSQETVYTAMFKELDAAIETLRANQTLPVEAFNRYDFVYYGNIALWYKYANSLKLRLAMRLSEVKPEVAKAKAAEAIAAGVLLANADNAKMHAPENRLTLIYNDWGDHRVGADIINYMNGYNDPRREKMFTKNPKGLYAGIRIGIDVGSKSAAVQNCSNMIVASTTPLLWLNAAEATFLRAEYELRWGSAESAKSLYEEAIRLSFEEYGASGVDAYVADHASKPAVYEDPLGKYSEKARQSEITVAWESGADKSEANLERVITQKWIAIFPLGLEAWAEHRRTGYPRLLPAIQDNSGGTVDLTYGARRLPYPIEEYEKNPANLESAIQLLNQESVGNYKGDGMGVRVWWDCKPYNN